jgi:hypothetical protein
MPFENGKHITLDEWKRRHPPQFSTTSTGAPLPDVVRQSVISDPPQAEVSRSASVKRAIQKATGVDLDAHLAEADAEAEAMFLKPITQKEI